LDVDTIFGDLGVNVYIRNTIFRKDPPSVVSGYGKRSINLKAFTAKGICSLKYKKYPWTLILILY
jgi:hypothetical protein